MKADGLSMIERLQKTGSMLPKGVAYGINGRWITWAEVKAERVKRQSTRLARILEIPQPERCAGYVWTFFVPGMIYGGWHLYLRTLGQEWWLSERRYPHTELIDSLMAIFPCGMLPIRENFYDWKEAFAHTYSRGKRGRRPQGVVFGWVLFGSSNYPKGFLPR